MGNKPGVDLTINKKMFSLTIVVFSLLALVGFSALYDSKDINKIKNTNTIEIKLEKTTVCVPDITYIDSAAVSIIPGKIYMGPFDNKLYIEFENLMATIDSSSTDDKTKKWITEVLKIESERNSATISSGILYVYAADSYNTSHSYFRCDGTADQVEINNAISAINNSGGRGIYLASGHYYIDEAIILKSNVHLTLSRSAIITLTSGSNQVMARNENWADGSVGDHDISIDGGIWKGNGVSQSRNTSVKPELGGYFGFGMVFHNVNNIKVTNVELDSTNSYALFFATCQNGYVKNITIWQDPKNVNNDGVHLVGCSSFTLRNILGYSNDDLVAVDASMYPMEELSNAYLYWTGTDSDSIYVTNVHSIMDKGKTNYTRRILTIASGGGATNKNLFVDGLSGSVSCSSSPYCVLLYNFLGTQSFWENISINNLFVSSPPTNIYTAVSVGLSEDDNLCLVKNLSVTNVIFINRNSMGNNAVVNLNGRVANFFGANLFITNTPKINNKNNVILKTSRSIFDDTNIQLDGFSQDNDTTTRNIIVENESPSRYNLSFTCISVRIPYLYQNWENFIGKGNYLTYSGGIYPSRLFIKD